MAAMDAQPSGKSFVLSEPGDHGHATKAHGIHRAKTKDITKAMGSHQVPGEKTEDHKNRHSIVNFGSVSSMESDTAIVPQEDRPSTGFFAKLTKSFTSIKERAEAAKEQVKERTQNAKAARSAALADRKLFLEEMADTNNRSSVKDDMFDDDHHPHFQDAAGQHAYRADLQNHLAKNAASMVKRGNGKDTLSPITRMSPERMERWVTEKAAAKAHLEAIGAADPATNLACWFDAGLMRDHRGHLTPKRPLPPDYAYASWATSRVPQLVHQQSGVVIWPVRFDLVPVFEHYAIDGGQHLDGTPSGMTHSTTVFHYCPKSSYNRIVEPPQDEDESEVQESHSFAEEIWDRIGDDLYRRNTDKIAGASEFSLPLVAVEPCKFPNREEVACATYREESGKHHHMAVGFCIALLVPTEKCLAVDEEHSEATVLVLAPGEAGPDDDIHGYDVGGSTKKKLMKWSARLNTLMDQKDETSTANKVEKMRLLDNLIDKGQVAVDETQEQLRLENRKEDRAKSLRAAKATVADLDDEEDRLEAKVGELDLEREKILRKIKHAMRAQEKSDAGQETHFLETDEYRVQKLHKQHEAIEHDIECVRTELRLLRADLEITIQTGAKGADDDGEQRTMRRRRRKKEDLTIFAGDCTDFVHEVGDEYAKLAGDVFRECFGGHLQGVEDLLEAKGDPNHLDIASGWTPLHMATSNGNIDMVILLIKSQAIPTSRSRDNGWVPMHMAVRKSNTKMLQCLIGTGPRAVRERSDDGCTPLMMCITSAPQNVRNKMISLLMEAHADANDRRDDGWSPLSYAVENDMKQICKALVLHGGKILTDMPGRAKGFTIWQAAARHKDLQDCIKDKLNSRDLQALERRFPGTIKRKGEKDDRKSKMDDD